MKSFLRYEDDPYYQKHLSESDGTGSGGNFDPNSVDDIAKSYKEVDLLPGEISKEYRVVMPENILFHAHQFVEISRCVRGRILYIVDRKFCCLHPGELIIFNSFVPHAWVHLDPDVEITDYSFSNRMLSEPLGISKNHLVSESNANLFLNIWHTKPNNDVIPIITSSDGLVMKQNYLFDFINSNFRYAFIQSASSMHAVFSALLNNVDIESREKRFAYEYVVYSKIIELIAQLLRFNSLGNYDAIHNKPEILISALEYINKNFNKNISLDAVAQQCFLTPQYFSTYFKKHTGMNFSDYLSNIRVERAFKELLDSEKSILEVALTCGFNSKTSFYRAWYARYQISPSQLREMNK